VIGDKAGEHIYIRIRIDREKDGLVGGGGGGADDKFFFFCFSVLFYLFSAAPISPPLLRPLIGINNAFLAWMSNEMDCPSCYSTWREGEGIGS
jgi:hypothetical protein